MRHCFIAFLLCQGLCASLQAQTPTFVSFKSYLIDQGSLTLAVADFNNDGKADAAIGFETGHLAVALGLGGGEFAPPIRTVVPGGAVDLAVADFDRDGKQDLMTVNKDGFQVLFYRGAGNGSFALTGSRNVSAGRPDRLGIADFDRDGVLDVAVATSVLGNNVWVYFGVSSGRGNYGFSSTRSVQMDVHQPKEILTTDIDADRDADIVTNFTVLFGDGAGNFVSSGPNLFGFPSNAGFPNAFATGDFNSDGAPDLAFGLTSSTPADRAIVIFHQQKTAGQPNGLFSLAQDIRNIAGSINHISVGRVDGVAPSDLVVTLNGNRHLTFDLEGEGFQVYHGETNGNFRPGRRFFCGQDPIDAALLDLDANGNNDMLVVNAGIFTRTMVILKGDGAGNFDVPPSFGLDSSPGGLATDDLDLDMIPDLVAGTQNGVSVLRGNGDGSFQPFALFLAGQIGPVAIGDFQ
ncbi:MAG: FG-GAP repeat domain-containing protein [Acidobacteriota bacterium]